MSLADKMLKQAYEAAPQDGIVPYFDGYIKLRVDKRLEARDLFETAISRGGRGKDLGRVGLAWVAELLGELDAAAAHLDAVETKNQDDLRLRRQQGQLADERADDFGAQSPVVTEQGAQAPGQGADPVPHWHGGQHALLEVDGRVGHASAQARGGEAATLATERDDLGVPTDPAAVREVEVLDATQARWDLVTPIPEPRSGHTTAPLLDGRLLVAGGWNQDHGRTVLVDLYDATLDRWTEAGELAVGRDQHSATLLAEGHVLVLGGQANGILLRGLRDAVAEVYDPTVDRWTRPERQPPPRMEHSAVVLRDGRLVVFGGMDPHHDRSLTRVDVGRCP